MALLELKIPPVLTTLVCAFAMWAVGKAAAAFIVEIPFHSGIAYTLFVLGGVMGLAGTVSFSNAGTTVNPMSTKGMSALVTSGVYKFTRNPQYVGHLLFLTGVSVLIGNALSAVLLPAFVLYMNKFQISPEERGLSVMFPEEFAKYRESVRRWL